MLGGNWVISYRWRIIAAAILFVGFFGYGAQYLQINNDMRAFFGKQNPQLLKFENIENIFSKNENVLIAIAPKDGKVFTRKTLAAIEELTALCWGIPYSSRVDSITNFQHIEASEDELIVEDLVQNARDLTNADIAKIKNIALSEPLLVNRLISSSGHVTGININVLKPDESRIEALSQIAHYVHAMTDDFMQKHTDIDIYLTGLIMFDIALGEVSQYEMSSLTPIMLLVLLLIVLISLRSIIGTLITLVVILFSVVVGMGTAGWMGIQITAPSSNAPIVILTLAVADCVHLLVTFFQLMRQGKSKNEAIVESMQINFQAVFLTSLTTAIGFSSMNFSEAPPFRDLGNIVSTGVLGAFLLSVFLLPALVSIIPIKVKVRDKLSSQTSINKIARTVIQHQRIIFGAFLLFSIAMCFGISRIELNDDYIRYFGTKYDFRNDSEFVMKNLTGLSTIEYVLNSGSKNGINDPDYLKTVDNFAAWFASQPKVVNVNTFTDSMKRINKKLHNDDPAYYRIPDKRQDAAQYRLLYEMSLPFGLDLNDQINVEKSSLRVFVTFADLTTKELRDADSRAHQWLKENAPNTMLTSGSGLSLLYAHISGRCIKSMLGATFGALLLISFILMLALRSTKTALISLIPNLLPIFMAFGLWGLTEGRVGLAFSVLAAVTIGIIVDDTTHILCKYLKARRDLGLKPDDAIIYTYNTVGVAIVVTSITLCAGFLVLSVSGFKPSSDMGIMTVMTLVIATILDLFLLPLLIIRFEKQKMTEQTCQDRPAFDQIENYTTLSAKSHTN